MSKCTLPPEGWECTREAGHDGPCAAIPVSLTSEVSLKAANDTITALRAQVKQLRAALTSAQKERDENHRMWEHWQTEAVKAQGELSRTSTAATTYHNAFNYAIKQRDAAQKERDEARETLDKMNHGFGRLAPKGTWLCEIMENIWRSKTVDEAKAIADKVADRISTSGLWFGDRALEAERDSLRSRVAALEEDKARLDWIENQLGVTFNTVDDEKCIGLGKLYPTWRSAIDAARNAMKGEK